MSCNAFARETRKRLNQDTVLWLEARGSRQCFGQAQCGVPSSFGCQTRVCKRLILGPPPPPPPVEVCGADTRKCTDFPAGMAPISRGKSCRMFGAGLLRVGTELALTRADLYQSIGWSQPWGQVGRGQGWLWLWPSRQLALAGVLRGWGEGAFSPGQRRINIQPSTSGRFGFPIIYNVGNLGS